MENRNAWINRPGRTHKEQGRCDAAGSLGVNVTLTPEEKKTLLPVSWEGAEGDLSSQIATWPKCVPPQSKFTFSKIQ